MYKLLGGLRDYFKYQDIQIDSTIFRLHNLFTTALLLACSLIITATQYVGQPISCIVNGIPPHVVNTFCWISSTFTMPDAFQRHVSNKPLNSFYSNCFFFVVVSNSVLHWPMNITVDRSLLIMIKIFTCTLSGGGGREVVKIIVKAICVERKSRTIVCTVNEL